MEEFPLWHFSVSSVLKSEKRSTEDTEKYHRVQGEIQRIAGKEEINQ